MVPARSFPRRHRDRFLDSLADLVEFPLNLRVHLRAQVHPGVNEIVEDFVRFVGVQHPRLRASQQQRRHPSALDAVASRDPCRWRVAARPAPRRAERPKRPRRRSLRAWPPPSPDRACRVSTRRRESVRARRRCVFPRRGLRLPLLGSFYLVEDRSNEIEATDPGEPGQCQGVDDDHQMRSRSRSKSSTV